MSTQDDDEDNGALMYSKAAVNNPVGNLEFDIKCKVDGETFLMFNKLVRECGTDRSGAVRDWVFLKTRGITFTDMVRHAEKVNRDKLFGTGPDGVLPDKGQS
jgi:hypothetical protein